MPPRRSNESMSLSFRSPSVAAASPQGGTKRIAFRASRSAVAVYVINLGYGFTGSGRPVSSYTFLSRALSGSDPVSGKSAPGNRLTTALGHVPVLLPSDFVLGIDIAHR